MGHRPGRDRCAALAARVRGFSRAVEYGLLRASQDRVRGPVRVSPPSWPLSTPTLRAADGDVRLVGVVCRSEARGRDARDRLGAYEAHGFSMFVCSYLRTPRGYGRDLGRFGRV